MIGSTDKLFPIPKTRNLAVMVNGLYAELNAIAYIDWRVSTAGY